MDRTLTTMGVLFALSAAAACQGAKDTPEGGLVVTPDAGASEVPDAGGGAERVFYGHSPSSKEPGRAPPYACTAPPRQCELACDAPVCTQVCNPAEPADCRWDCAAPTCHCTAQPTAACDLREPAAPCDVKCERPNCTEYCPRCTSLPCAPCETVCEPAHCVSHCAAPIVTSSSGVRRPTHCLAPRPACTATCSAPPTCRWDRVPACDGDAGSCPPVDHYQPSCEQASCQTTCAPIPNARCTVTGCDEACDAVTDCTQDCDKPSCVVASDGTTTCDAPSGCKTSCKGGLCHVTTCN